MFSTVSGLTMNKKLQLTPRFAEFGSKMAETTSWDKLPLIVTSKVFGYLKNKDRFNASLVCKDWSEALYSANIWRRIELWNSGIDYNRVEKTVKKMEKVGAWVKDLKINVWVVTSFSVVNMSRIFDSLHEARLTRVELNIQKFQELSYIIDSQLLVKFSVSVNRFIGTQTCLPWFNASQFDVPVDLGLEILENLSQASGNSLQHLHITSFFPAKRLFPNGVHSIPAFRSSMSRFTQLRSVKMQYDCLDEEILLGLARNCAGILQDISLQCKVTEPSIHTISSSTWRQVRRLCPNLRVSMSLLLLQNNTPDVARFLPQGMPLRALVFSGEQRDVTGLVQQLYHFTDSLEELGLYLHSELSEERQDTISEEVVNVIICCRNLKRLILSTCVLKRQHVSTICEAQRDGRLQLEYCNLQVAGGVQIRNISELYAYVKKIRARR